MCEVLINLTLAVGSLQIFIQLITILLINPQMPITTAADEKNCDIFPNFRKK